MNPQLTDTLITAITIVIGLLMIVAVWLVWEASKDPNPREREEGYMAQQADRIERERTEK